MTPSSDLVPPFGECAGAEHLRSISISCLFLLVNEARATGILLQYMNFVLHSMYLFVCISIVVTALMEFIKAANAEVLTHILIP